MEEQDGLVLPAEGTAGAKAQTPSPGTGLERRTGGGP